MQALEMVRQIVVGLQVLEQELLLFASFWFILGALDDLGVDVCWAWLKLSGRAKERRISRCEASAPLQGRAAIFIACWQEATVIGHTVRHALAAWPQRDFTLYVGCYRNDPATVAAAVAAAGGDRRVRVVIHDRPGPTTKADCLNRVYAAMCDDERRSGRRFRALVLHDSEDMVHPAELAVFDAALARADFVQLPVRPEPQPDSPWVAGHYADEFTESHAKALVVRDALGAAIPAAGVGCAFSREMIARIATIQRGTGTGSDGPFASECLTEDYELGVLVGREGGLSRFVRMRDENGQLVATRAYFPAGLEASVRQKSRWVHGIAFQGWDRLGWSKGGADTWMALRDRRGPLTAFVLTCAYLLVVVEGLLALAQMFGLPIQRSAPTGLRWMVILCFASFVWRCVTRFAFTAREYGAWEGVCAVMRIPIGNLIAIIAGQRALASYVRTLLGGAVQWEKTSHDAHPAGLRVAGASPR